MPSFEKALVAFTGASFIGTVTQIAKGKLSAVFLGASGVGIVNQVIGVWGLASLIAGLGFYSGMVRHLSEYWAAHKTIEFRSHLTSSAIATLLASLALTVAGCLCSDNISYWVFGPTVNYGDLIALIFLGLPLFTLAQVYRAVLSATNSVRALVRARIFADLSSVALFAILVVFWNIRGAILGYAALQALYLLAVVWMSRNKLAFRDLFSIPDMRITQVRKNIPYGLNAIFSSSIGIISSLAIGRHLIETVGMAGNGLFATAMKVTTAYLGGIASAASGQVFPQIARCETQEEMVVIVNQVLRLYFLLIPPVIMMLMGLGAELMRILFSDEFIPAAVLLLIILPADLFRIFAETAGIPLMAIHRLKVLTGVYATWAGIYVFLAIFFAGDNALLGCAFAYLISQACHAGVLFAVAARLYGFNLSRENAKLILFSLIFVAASGCVLFYSKESLFDLLLMVGLLLCWFLLFKNESLEIFLRIMKKGSKTK